MLRLKNASFSNKQITILEYVLILLFSLLPVFFKHSYSSNIYLAWEGAYRLYLGQIPFKDFGLTVGFGSWLIPALFFKIFGPYLITLIIAQAFINFISALAFRSILKQVKVKQGIRVLSVLLYLISFSFFNQWPWYNHSVIVFEFIGMAFLLQYILNERRKYALVSLFLASFFIFLSFFTKQDAGAFAFMIAIALIVCHAIYEKKIWPVVWFLLFYIFVGLCFFLPFIPYHIGYWFNYGQPPQSARISLYDIIDAFLGGSEWIKFYILIILLIWMAKFKNFRQNIKNKHFVIFSLLVTGILFEAIIVQVTSFTSGLNIVYFHSFAIAYIFALSGLAEHINFRKLLPLCLVGVFIVLWWSQGLWPNAQSLISRYFPRANTVDTNEVSIHTFQRPDPHKTWKTSQTADVSKWKSAPWKVFKGVSMPISTIEGINKLLNDPIVKNKGKDLKVLNMSELTPLAEVIGYTPETGSDIPLWYHKDVGIFEKQIKEYERKIKDNYYDVAIFEYIPILNNFFPFEIRNALNAHYHQIDSFPAPRDLFLRVIEVYIKKPQE